MLVTEHCLKSNVVFFLWIRNWLNEHPVITPALARELFAVCMLARSRGGWSQQLGWTRIVEVHLLAELILAGYDQADLTARIRESQGNVKWYEGDQPEDVVAGAVEHVRERLAGLGDELIDREIAMWVRGRGSPATSPAEPHAERLARRFHEPLTLRLHQDNRQLVEDPLIALLPGVETLVVRDDLGRKLDVAALAWGPLAVDVGMWPVSGAADGAVDDDIIVSNRPLDANKTYLLIVVEHPDVVITID
ncbi:MAG TPA: hypothetical protein VM869_19295 [Enhygromyxa sp.]|nr:hypothetical protein [Enhygromyxa sp.]